jgi:hypothetical protein
MPTDEEWQAKLDVALSTADAAVELLSELAAEVEAGSVRGCPLRLYERARDIALAAHAARTATKGEKG